MKIPVDEIFQLKAEFDKDPRRHKINGGIGVYLDEQAKPFVLDTVKEVSKRLDVNNFNYLPLAGDPIFLKETAHVVFGNDIFKERENFIAKQGVMGGTNGLFVWGNLIRLRSNKPTLLISNPAWENHKRIFSSLGFTIKECRHLDEKKQFNYQALKKALLQLKKGYVLFQGGKTHNPTGTNPSMDQWKEVVKIIKENKNVVLFDFAYMGLDESIDKDSSAIRLFIQNRISTSVVISFSKNMTLYQHRTGALFILLRTRREKREAEKSLEYIFRMVNSTPAAFGEIIAKTILESNELKHRWTKDLKAMANSIDLRRSTFIKKTNGAFDFMTNNRGLFSLLHLSPKQILQLKKKHGIYLLSNSRINFGGISINNIQKIAQIISFGI